VQQYGNRGYRLVHLAATLDAGRLHLAAQALGLGAVGSTSFDDEVIAAERRRAARRWSGLGLDSHACHIAAHP
jgi:hypothetical protein